jgi:hypothetical protein
LKKIILAAAAVAAFTAPAYAAPGNTATATDGAATAEVVAPITITHDANAVLNFGKFTAGTAGGSVAVTTGGVGTPSGDVVLLSDSTNSADAFTVAGQSGRTFTITPTGGSVSNGSATMAFTVSAAGTGTLDSSGSAPVAVGGTLTVGGNQAAGVYTGSYSVTVAYN